MLKLPLDQMTRTEKILVMETLWQDLSRDESLVESPSWHGEVLAETEKRVASGEETFIDWETAKKQLRKQLE